MAALKSKIARTLKTVLSEEFPPPDRIRLIVEGGIIGMVTSSRFQGLDSLDRVDLIQKILNKSFTPLERQQIQIVVGVTPDEATFYGAVQARRPSKN